MPYGYGTDINRYTQVSSLYNILTTVRCYHLVAQKQLFESDKLKGVCKVEVGGKEATREGTKSQDEGRK